MPYVGFVMTVDPVLIEVMLIEHGVESTTVPAAREPDMIRLAGELVAPATDRGLALTGEGGQLTALTRRTPR